LNEETGYYIGNLLVTPSVKKQNFDVVDGQQRLTTITLFFLAIYEELLTIMNDAKNLEVIEDNIYTIKADIPRKLRTNEGMPKLKLLDSDNEILTNYLQVFDGKTKGKFGNRTFGRRYKFIQELIRNKEETSNISKLKKLQELYSKLNKIY